MKTKYCDKIEKLFNRSKFRDIFYALNYEKVNGDGNYLWVMRNSNDDLAIVIHGGEYEPFEVKLIKGNDGRAIDKHFDTLEELEQYINKDLLEEMMVHEI